MWQTSANLGRLALSKRWEGEPTNTPPRWTRPGICRTAFDFLRVFDRGRLEWLEEILAQPDEPCMRRGSVLKFEGDPHRFRMWCGRRLKAIRLRELAQFGLEETND